MKRAAEERREAKDDIVVECELDAPPEKVWRALTVPELLARWIAAEELGDGETAPSYETLEARPFSRLRLAWRDEAASQADSLVTVELAPRPGGRTWFRLTHSASALRAANANAPMARAA